MKSGFTLVELLAVIVILAVLALIATPVVLSIIDDTKESAMLRSAEMYLSGVENAVMRENMNSGGNFRPNECEIADGTLSCNSTTVEVEVNGEVPETGSIVFENGKIKEVTLNYESGTIVKDPNGDLVYEGSTGEKIAISPKKETYTIGEEVTIGEEIFYVIADDNDKITLLTRDCIDTINLVQSVSANPVAFSSTNYWSSIATEYPYDLIEEGVPDESHYAAKAAYDYGNKLGGTGRLMTKREGTELEATNSDIFWGANGKSSDTYLNYWFSYASSSEYVGSAEGSYDFSSAWYSIDSYYCVRPVVEILKTKIN